jgi:hypothetical protein
MSLLEDHMHLLKMGLGMEEVVVLVYGWEELL